MIVSNHELHATEEDVFEAVMSWGEAVAARSGARGVNDAVSDLLPHLRLDEMDHAFLIDRVQQAGVFSAKELLAIMANRLDKHAPSNKRVLEGKEGTSRQAEQRRRIG